MQPADDATLRDLLRPEHHAACVVYVQEAVKNTQHPGAGSLLVVKRQPTATQPGDHFVVWLPTSYLLHLAPALVSPASRLALAAHSTPDATPTDAGGPGTFAADAKAAWLTAVCHTVGGLVRLRRKTTLRGKKLLQLYPGGSDTSTSLCFNDGGVASFLDALRAVVRLTADPTRPDDFLVQAAPLAAVAANARYPADPTPSLQEELYGDSGRRPGRGLLGGVMGLGAVVASSSAKLAGAVAGQLDRLVDSDADADAREEGEGAGPEEGGREGDEGSGGFDMMEAVADVESIVPVVSVPRGVTTALGAPLSAPQWRGCFSADGHLDPDTYSAAREVAFRGGVAPEIRAEVWAFALGVYEPGSTAAERQSIDEANAAQYARIQQQWRSVDDEQAAHFQAFRERRVAVEKDVARTDRHLPEYADDGSPMLVALHNVLMTYAFFHFDIGYCQGMSDLLAVILVLVDGDEARAFSLFKGLLRTRAAGNFYNDSRHNMALQLSQLEGVVRRFLPQLYRHLERHHATGMCFCFRWLLVYFKREFKQGDVRRLWDVIFCCPVPQFEVFVAAGLLRAVSQQIIDHELSYDELLKFTNNMCGRVAVEDAAVLGLDLYAVVVEEMAWHRRRGGSEADHRLPTLDEVVAAPGARGSA